MSMDDGAARTAPNVGAGAGSAAVCHSALAPPAAPDTERVLWVRHWTDAYFSFGTTRAPGLRFDNGQFLMIGLMIDGRLVRRAYSLASANWEEELEFFSIKVADGALTSRLQHLAPGDLLHVGRKPVGTLRLDDLRAGSRLWLLATGTGLAPFLSLLKGPETWERFDQVLVVHGVRRAADLAYREFLERDLARHELLGERVRGHLRYVPLVSREPFERTGRITHWLADGRLEASLGLPPLSPEHDRLMLCGGPSMLADLRQWLDRRGFEAAPQIGVAGDYVFERAFVER